MAHVLAEGAEFVGESGKTYLAVSPLGQDNVWTAVEKDTQNVVVLKQPGPDDTTGWPRFQHEMIMHELFKDCPSIRQQLDRIPPTSGNSPPMLVLEITETTLWTARTKRPFTKAEIDSIAEAMLVGLREVHAKGLVYADLKMQNVMLNGFDTSATGQNGDGSNPLNLETKLGDLGIVMSPAMGKVQPVAYRAPEIHFKGVISEAADIWSWGLIYCHLLEAQTRFSKTGLYDDLHPKSQAMFHREEAVKDAIANDYDVHHEPYYQDGCILPWNDHDHKKGSHWDVLKERGLEEEEIEFLQWVLTSDPRKRPTASSILRRRFGPDGGRASGFATAEAIDAGLAGGAARPRPTRGDTEHAKHHLHGEPMIPVASNDPTDAGDPQQALMSSSPDKEKPSSLVSHPLVAEAIHARDDTGITSAQTETKQAPTQPNTPSQVPTNQDSEQGSSISAYVRNLFGQSTTEANSPNKTPTQPQSDYSAAESKSEPSQAVSSQQAGQGSSSADYVRNLIGQGTPNATSSSAPFKELQPSEPSTEEAKSADAVTYPWTQSRAEKHPLSRNPTEDSAVKDGERPKLSGTFLSYR